MIPKATLQRFETLIRARAGLNMREQEAAALEKTLRARLQATKIAESSAYLDFLASDSAPALEEWKQLFVLLTNQESYFFRDAEQLGVIRARIVPELLRLNRESRTLRIWSAGCSTGEEPYSLAMMLADVPELHDWRVTILGTDLSAAALERARRGIYGAWSFRALSERDKARFFIPRGKDFEIAPRLRQNVVFAPNNLFGDNFPNRKSEIHDMDLILCRNVFIYFGRDAIAQVLKKFAATLRSGRFLVCGHAELHDVPLGDFETRTFPQSVVYQRISPSRLPKPGPVSSPARRVVPIPPSKMSAAPRPSLVAPTERRFAASRPIVSPVAATSTNIASTVATSVVAASVVADNEKISAVASMLEDAKSQIRQGRHIAARETLLALLGFQPDHVGALCLLAQAQANAGNLDEAHESCARAKQISPLSAMPYHLQARIAEERGEGELAKSLLKKVLYLEPRSVWAALELSAIYAREGDATRAAQTRRAALQLLEDLGEDSPVPSDEYAVEAPLSVGDLKRQLGLSAIPTG